MSNKNNKYTYYKDLEEYTNEELVVMIQETNDARLWDELDKRTEKLYSWVMNKKVHPYYKENMKEDIMSILKVGWVKAVNTFNIKKATAGFVPYCSFIMTQNYVMFARKITKDKIGNSVRDENLSAVLIDGHEEDERTIHGCVDIILQSECEGYNIVESDDYVERLLDKLKDHNKIQYIAVKEHYIEGTTQKELGLMLELSQSYISRNIKKGISFLKKEIMNNNNDQ